MFRIISLLFIILFLNLFCKDADPLKPYGDSIKVTPLKVFNRANFPTKGWQLSTLQETGINPEKLMAMEKYAFTVTGNAEERIGIRTDAVVIIKNEKLVYEKYARGYNKDSSHLAWSVTKSFINALYGIAIRENKLSIDDPASKYLEEFKRTELHRKVTIRHLLNMNSGLAASEGYESGPLKSSVIAMLYTRGRHDMGSFCAGLDMAHEPGTYVYYSSCDTNILSKILTRVYSKEEYENLPWKELFNKLGYENVTFEHDGNENFVGSSYLYLSARDLAKFGYLYLNDGIWDKERILPEGWVDFTRTSAPGYKTTAYYTKLEEYIYTAHWYANEGVPERGVPVIWKDAPKDTFAALGHWGQMMFVIPSLDMIVVRYGDDRDHTFSKNEFLKLIVNSIEK